MERDFDGCIGRDRFAIFRSWIELPGLHCFDGFFVQTQADAAGHFNVPGDAVCAHDQAKNDCALILGFAGFFRIFRIWRVDSLGSADAATDAEDTAANAAATAFTNAWTGTDANTAAASTSNATAGSCPVRGRTRRHGGSWISEIQRVVRLQLNFRRHNHRRRNCQFRMIVSHYNRRGSDLLQRLLRDSALRRLELVTIASATTASNFFGRRLHDRRIQRRRHQNNGLVRLLHNRFAEIVGPNQNQADHNYVNHGRKCGTALFVIVKAPNILYWNWFRSQYKGGLLFWEKGILEILRKRLPQPRLRALRHEQIKFGFRFRRRLRWFEFQGCHYVTRVVS